MCTLGCNLKPAPVSIAVMDLSSLGIASASDSEYDSLHSVVIDEDLGSEPPQDVKNKDFSELSFVSKPDIIQLPSAAVDHFSFTIFCTEISSKVPVLIDTGAVLNVISLKFAKFHKLELQQGKQIKVKFGNGSTAQTSQFTTLHIEQGSYSQKIEFFVADIHLPMYALDFSCGYHQN